MSIIYVLIPIAVLLIALAIYLFFWAVRTDQFEDLEKQGFSILFDRDNDDIDNIEQTSLVQQKTEQCEHTASKENKFNQDDH